MKSQKSFESSNGLLYLVGTPIGNLEDMTFRAVRLLQEVDGIAAEDTRNTKKLCTHFEISTPLFSYHEHNLEKGGEKILALLAEGKSIALVSDAGMPCISDPGQDIAQKAIAQGYAVVPIPGANAALTALIASGIAPQPFTFHGFLPRNKKERKEKISEMKNRKETSVFYEAPHRLKETLQALLEQMGPERKITLARELTKRFEEFVRGTLEEALEWSKTEPVRGEFCLVLEGGTGEQPPAVHWWESLSIVEHVEALMEKEGIRSKLAIAQVAEIRKLPKREVYQAYHVEP